MAKWYAGMVMTIVIIIGIFISMLFYPWFYIETEYPEESGVESMKVSYSMKEYEVITSDNPEKLDDAELRPVEEGTFQIKDKADNNGWDGDYNADFNITGRPAQLKVANITYYFLILTIILAIVCVILIPLAGFGKIPSKAALAVTIIMTIFAILAPIYYGIFMPTSFDDDAEGYYEAFDEALDSNEIVLTNESNVVKKPESLQSIWGDSSNVDVYRQVNIGGAQSHWRPDIGWWITIVMIFLAIISIGTVEGPKKPSSYYPPSDYRDDYYDDRRGGGRPPYADDRRGPPPRPGYDDPYDDRYPPPRGGYPPSGSQMDYYDDGPPPYPDYQSEWEPPPQGPPRQQYPPHQPPPPPPPPGGPHQQPPPPPPQRPRRPY